MVRGRTNPLAASRRILMKYEIAMSQNEVEARGIPKQVRQRQIDTRVTELRKKAINGGAPSVNGTTRH